MCRGIIKFIKSKSLISLRVFTRNQNIETVNKVLLVLTIMRVRTKKGLSKLSLMEHLAREIDKLFTIHGIINSLQSPIQPSRCFFQIVQAVFDRSCNTRVSSCTAGRSFSALIRVKTRLRSTMAQERLQGLMLMTVNF